MSGKTLTFISVAFILLSCNQSIQKNEAAAKQIEARVDSLLKLMTPEEKIGQLTLFTSDWDITGVGIPGNFEEDIKAGKIGAVFYTWGVKNIKKLQELAIEKSRLHIPLIFGYDIIHGFKTIFPIPLGQAASWDLEAIGKSERITAIEATAVGLNWTFAPMVDICRDPRWGRIAEGAGEDPYLGSKIAAARVNGFQNHDLSANNTLLACVKHFAAYGAPVAGREYNSADMSERMLREVYLPPYKAAVDAGAGSVMSAFNEVNGVPATGNKYLIRNTLKKEWDFSGFVVSDYTSVAELATHGVAVNEKEAGEIAINAGIDVDMQGATYLKYLAQSLKEGKISIETLDEAVRRVLRIKYMLGLFDDPYRYLDERREKDLLMCDEHLKFAREFAAKSIVLLKNDGQLLPISKKMKTLAVIGPHANSNTDLNGCWAAEGDPGQSITLFVGLKKKLPGADLLYSKGCDIEGENRAGFREARATAMKADVVILALGESAGMTGEAASRSDIGLPGIQQEFAEYMLDCGKPVIVVLLNGRPLDLSWFHDHVPAILEAWFPGTCAGDAIADVLTGDYNPSGKLPVTFPRNLGQVPVYYSEKNTGRPFSSKNRNTSRYLDVPNSPLYPFGYGLSYTTFSYSEITLSSNKITTDEKLIISLKVSNTGNFHGTETVQLYVQDLVGSVTRPLKELKDFKKIELQAGEIKKIEFELHPDQLKFYDINMNYIVEPGEFLVFVGTNSADTKSAKFELIR